MPAKGSCAFATFTIKHDIRQYTRAKIFSKIGKKTELFIRFSTIEGKRGAAAAEVGGAEKFMQERHIFNYYKADPAFVLGVAKALGIYMDNLKL